MASEDPSVRRSGVEYEKRTLDVIHFMGGGVFGEINYSSWPEDTGEGIVDKSPYVERSVACMKEVGKTAEDYGITY